MRPRLEVLGYKPIIALAEAAGYADATRSIEHAALSPFFVPDAALDPDWVAYFASFDVVVSYLFDPGEFFAANLERAGVGTLLKCSHRVDPQSGVHAARQLAAPLEELALYLDDPGARLAIDGRLPAELPGGAPLVAVHPGSGSATKNWGYENWALACAALRRKVPAVHFVVLSGEAEAETIGDFLSLLARSEIAHTHLDSLPLPDLAATAASFDLFLGHDTGTAHLTAACGVPCVLLFGPTDPAVWAPANAGVTAIRAQGGTLGRIAPAEVAGRAALALARTD